MDTTTPLLADAFRLLLADLYDHLYEAESLANEFKEWSDEDIESARKLIPDLVVTIRGLLIEHEMTANGTCRTCPSAWPCPVVTTIHALVKDPGREFVAILSRANEDG